jgi:hypothetical protein
MTTKNSLSKIFLLIGMLCLSFSLLLASQANALPVTGFDMQSTAKTTAVFMEHALSGKSVETVSSVSVPGKFSYSVVQSGNDVPSGYVLGQFAQAAKKDNIGLLAHNYLAGYSFFSLGIGDQVIVTYSSGATETFLVTNILRFQATDTTDYSKPFLNSNGKQITAKTVFNQAYRKNGLTFQTCIYAEGSNTWGLLFVQAVPQK